MVRRGLGRRPVVVLAWREFSEISVVFYAENTFQNTQLVQACGTSVYPSYNRGKEHVPQRKVLLPPPKFEIFLHFGGFCGDNWKRFFAAD